MNMARPTRIAWPLLKFRQNKGLEMQDLVAELGISNVTLNRLEKGGVIRRVVAAKYLLKLGIDLNDPGTIPPNMKIIDHGDRVAVEFHE